MQTVIPVSPRATPDPPSPQASKTTGQFRELRWAALCAVILPFCAVILLFCRDSAVFADRTPETRQPLSRLVQEDTPKKGANERVDAEGRGEDEESEGRKDEEESEGREDEEESEGRGEDEEDEEKTQAQNEEDSDEAIQDKKVVRQAPHHSTDFASVATAYQNNIRRLCSKKEAELAALISNQGELAQARGEEVENLVESFKPEIENFLSKAKAKRRQHDSRVKKVQKQLQTAHDSVTSAGEQLAEKKEKLRKKLEQEMRSIEQKRGALLIAANEMITVVSEKQPEEYNQGDPIENLHKNTDFIRHLKHSHAELSQKITGSFTHFRNELVTPLAKLEHFSEQMDKYVALAQKKAEDLRELDAESKADLADFQEELEKSLLTIAKKMTTEWERFHFSATHSSTSIEDIQRSKEQAELKMSTVRVQCSTSATQLEQLAARVAEQVAKAELDTKTCIKRAREYFEAKVKELQVQSTTAVQA